jgi:hypothetical protein
MKKEGQIEIIKKIFTDISNPASFSTPMKVWEKAKKKDPNISLQLVKNVLLGLDSYSLHRRVKKVMKTRKYISSGLNKYFQMDLMVLNPETAKSNFQKSYILICIDTFSRKLFARALRTKSGSEVAKAIQSIIDENQGIPPSKIVTDKGTEFLNWVVQNLFKKYNINHFTTENVQHAAIAERIIRTLREKIGKYLTYKNTRSFINKLGEFVKGYNKSSHKALPKGMSPSEVNKENELKVWKHQFAKHFRKAPGFYGKAKAKVGDIIRLSEWQGRFKKSSNISFTKEKFIVTHILETKPRTYKVSALDGEEILGAFYPSEILVLNQ